MCTVTVHRTRDSLLLTMNRDEARSRGPELPPARHGAPDGTAWLAPADSDKGGTWFAMNNSGLLACLLNRYQDTQPEPPADPRSRGEIIPALMEAHTVAEAQDLLASGILELEKYPAFTLVIAGKDGAERLDWRGTGLVETTGIASPWYLVTSSFFDPELVLPWRQEAFDAWLAEGAPLDHGVPAIHLCRPAGKEAIAPLMARDISCTRSITQASVDWSACTGSLRHMAVEDGVPQWEQFARGHTLDLESITS